jgi:hypothetical protein
LAQIHDFGVVKRACDHPMGRAPIGPHIEHDDLCVREATGDLLGGAPALIAPEQKIALSSSFGRRRTDNKRGRFCCGQGRLLAFVNRGWFPPLGRVTLAGVLPFEQPPRRTIAPGRSSNSRKR